MDQNWDAGKLHKYLLFDNFSVLCGNYNKLICGDCLRVAHTFGNTDSSRIFRPILGVDIYLRQTTVGIHFVYQREP